jgi:hypothetical protein
VEAFRGLKGKILNLHSRASVSRTRWFERTIGTEVVNFLLHRWFELKFSDPFTRIKHKRIRKFQSKPMVGSKVISCRLTPHFRASVKTVRRDAGNDNFSLHCWFELKNSDPFTRIKHKRIRKFQSKPYIGSKVLSCRLTPQFWASVKTVGLDDS